jgi:hypothetical protein
MCNYVSRDAQRTNGSLKLSKKLKIDFLKQVICMAHLLCVLSTAMADMDVSHHLVSG